MNLTRLVRQKGKEYLANKQKSGLLRSTFLEERPRQLAESGNSMEEKKINHFILTEKNNERARRLGNLKPRIRRTEGRILDTQH